MHGDLQRSQEKVTQVSCVARINANSQILAILFLLFGAFPEIDTRNRNRKEINPKRMVTRRADSVKDQTDAPRKLTESEGALPA